MGKRGRAAGGLRQAGSHERYHRRQATRNVRLVGICPMWSGVEYLYKWVELVISSQRAYIAGFLFLLIAAAAAAAADCCCCAFAAARN